MRVSSHFRSMMDKGQLVVFPTAGVYSKAVFDRFQGFSGSYLVVCESMAKDDTDIKNVRRLVVAAEGLSLYSRLVNLQKDHRGIQTILKGIER